jgi:hypothetical protein
MDVAMNIAMDIVGLPKRVAKIFLHLDDHYVFSQKRAPWLPEDAATRRLELIGGTIVGDETPFEALLRELQEEETSGMLAEKARTLRPTPQQIVVYGEPHYIYRMTISGDEFERMIHDPEESYGFDLVSETVIADREKLRENAARFTWKTRGIFQALGLM